MWASTARNASSSTGHRVRGESTHEDDVLETDGTSGI